LIFPGNQIWDGEFRLLPTQQSFEGMFTPRLLDPDKISPAPNSVQKGFATYVNPNGAIIECGFLIPTPDGLTWADVWTSAAMNIKSRTDRNSTRGSL